MAQITNISSQALRVPLLEDTTGQRVVQPGETVEVPDQLAQEFTWPDVTWRVERTTKAPAKSKEA